MTTSTESAVAKVDEKKGPTGLVPLYKGEFELVLPSHIKSESFVQLAVAALRKNDKLMQAATDDPASLIYALRDAARLGLEPGTEQYWLTPRPNKGKWTVLGIPGYEGEIELMYRAGAVDSVIVEAVFTGDTFDYVAGRDARPVHVVDWFGDRGDLVGAYAYAVMKGGATSKVCIAGKMRIDRAKAASPTADKSFSPWQSDPAAMYMKTAVHDLAKWVPTSAEYLREQLRALADVAGEVRAAPIAPPVPAPADLPEHDPGTGEVLQGEVVDGEDPPLREDWPATATAGSQV